ncbi:MAG: YjcQ family protein, partial [Clostridia bacterium]
YTVLNISECRFASYIEMMLDAGYIKGVRVFSNICGNTQVEDNGIRITLKGLEYLQENSIMQKIYKQAKGITELIP